ncbi:MAG: cobalamin-dependent protein [Candidatus Coatesbacteria bacterium]|nr:cobalamin-dependent protein [Candidatus Coatesbacteria bacterium]
MAIQDCDGPIDVLLVYPPMPRARQLDLPYGNEVPLSVATLAAFLEEQGIRTEIIDLDLHREPYRLLRKLVAKLRPRVVGFTALTPHIYNAHKAATQVKDIDASIVTVVGGIHASALPEDTLYRFPMFDYVVIGEGEITLYNLIMHKFEGTRPDREPGLAFRVDCEPVVNPRRPQIEDLDELPFAAREKLEHRRYAGSSSNYYRLPTTCIAASRGCPFNCTNCSKGVYGRRSLRVMSPERAIAELEHCKKTLGIRNFKMIDDTITSDKKWIHTFCEELLKREMDLTWSTMARVDAADLPMLKHMKKAGCFQLKWGPECGTEKSLNRIKKGITLEQSEKAMELCQKAGIESNASFMIGIPGETADDIEATIEFACKISPDVATFAILKPFPGSAIYDEAVADGRILHTVWDEYLHQGFALMKHDVLSEDELERLFKRCYNRFYFRPKYWAKRVKWFFKQPIREGRIFLENGWMLISKK